MTSPTFHVCYASVANVLFEHIEQDLLLLTTALLDDDDDFSVRCKPDCIESLDRPGTHVSMP